MHQRVATSNETAALAGEWRDLKLGDVLTLQRGFDLPARLRSEGPFPIVSSSGVTGFHARARVQPPGVVIGRYGSLGSVHWVTDPYWPLNTALWVKDFKGNDPRFVSYLLQTLAFDGSAASAVPGVNRNHLHALPIRCPGIDTQRRVATLLAAFDELIEINGRRIALLEDLARSVYREWFVRFRFPGHERVEFIDSEVGPIPEGWRVVAASEVFAINPKRARSLEPFRKVVMADLSESHSVVFPSAWSERPTGSRFTRDDVLLARISPCLENGKTALVKFAEPAELVVGSTEFIVLRGIKVGPAFTYCAARDERLRQHAIKSMSGASGRQRVASNTFESFPMVEPSRELAMHFEDMVGPMFEAAYGFASQDLAIARARDVLLPRLVTGRLDISDVDLGSLLTAEAG